MPNHAADTRQVEVSSARSFTTVATGADGALNPDQQRRDRFTAMANVIEQAAQPIRRRLAQLEELITEQQQLKKALDAEEPRPPPTRLRAEVVRGLVELEWRSLPPRPLPSAAFWALEIHPRQEEPP